jgi:MoaA/NifB/PqqE/SkfB family radical SAM enzyme
MFNFGELYKIEIELTTQCQASCPMCSRNFHGAKINKNIKNVSWSIEEFKKIISFEVLNRVKIISFCGVYGDPLLCKDVLEICKYIKENSNVELRIHTNGSFRDANWWKTLADVLPQKHIVFFGIDGFKESHEKYRIGTNFDKIIKNAKAFIKNGGVASAQFINFEHNIDDFDKLKLFLSDLGFYNVFQLNSDRFRNNNFSVLDKNLKEIYKLTPITSDVLSIKDDNIPMILNENKNITITCRSSSQKELYIDANKHLYPCCETATIVYEIERLDEPNFNSILPTLKNQILQIHKEYNNMTCIDLIKTSIEEILSDSKYLQTWQKYWNLKKSFVCSAVCGQINDKKFINRDSQF